MVSRGIRRGRPHGSGLKSSRLLLRTLKFLLLTIGVLSPASASLINYPDIDISGTGHGTVNEILTFGNVGSGPNMAASGCVRWGVVTPGFGDVYGGCPTVTLPLGNLQDDQKSHTSRAGAMGIESPLTLAIILDGSEPGNVNQMSLMVSQLILSFYSPISDIPIYSPYLKSPWPILDGSQGSGGSGNVFVLDLAQVAEAERLIGLSGYSFSDVRIGLGAELQQFDGHAYFWVGNIPRSIPPEAVPEPATFLLFGGGLLALGLAGRRFRRK